MITNQFKLVDAKVGQRVVIIEPIGEEIRWKHFVRTDDTPKNPNYVAGLALRTVQGYQGRKPRFDTGELPYPAEWPASSLVVDAAQIHHDWTEAHAGLMIVHSSGWMGIYLHGKLIHKISPSEHPYHGGEAPLAIKLAEEMELTIGNAVALWNGHDILPDNLTKLKLELL